MTVDSWNTARAPLTAYSRDNGHGGKELVIRIGGDYHIVPLTVQTAADVVADLAPWLAKQVLSKVDWGKPEGKEFW